jgi:two-component system response regulator AlgR
MKILICDDEAPARERLRAMIEQEQLGEVVAEAETGQQALQMIQQTAPDVVLLDIRMPGMDGVEAAQHINQLPTPPAIVFTTAFNEYALQAFETHAVDYLLKPVRQARLSEALAAATRLSRAQLQALRGGPAGNRERTHITARMAGELQLIAIEAIRYFQAEHKYVTVRHAEGQVLIEESLRSLEEEFGDRFLRIHRNALVALEHIGALEKDNAGRNRIRFKDIDDRLEVSRRHLPGLRKRLKRL